MAVRRRTWLLGLGLVGCIAYEHNSEEDAGGPAGAGDESTSVGTSDAPTTTDAPPTSEGGTSGGGDTDGHGGGECDLWLQDCPEGSKCAPVDTDADGIHDAAKCVPLAEMPHVRGDDCQVEGSIASGVDDCGESLLCWGVDAENQGRCVQMCKGSPSQPKCPDGLLCDQSNGGVLNLCVQPCDPLAPSCPQGKVCIPGSEAGFICDTDASGDGGAYGDACEFINVCDNGLLCAPSGAVPGCVTQGCCTEYCDLMAPDNLCSGAPAQHCEAFFDPGTAPPGYEDVGVCTIPM